MDTTDESVSTDQQATPTQNSLKLILATIISTVLLPILVNTITLFIEYRTGWFAQLVENRSTTNFLSFLIPSIAGLFLSFIISSLILFSIWLRPYRYVREIYATTALVTGFQLFLLITLSFVTRFMPWHILFTLVDAKESIYPTSLVDYGFLLVTSILCLILISNGYQNWIGLKSIEQRQRESEGKTQGFLSDAVDGLKRVWKRQAFLISREKMLIDYVPQLTLISESLSWKDQAKELIRLSSSSYRFNSDDWHDRYGYWIGTNINTGGLVCVYPAYSSVNSREIEAFISYSKRIASTQKKKVDELIIAIRGDTLPRISASHKQSIRIDTEANLLDHLVDFRDYYNDIRNRVEYNHLIPSNFTVKDVYVPACYLTLSGDMSSENVEDYLTKWLEEPGFRQVVLLGQYGQGKSTTALMFAYNLLFQRSREKTRIPILIELRGKSPSTLAPIELLGAWASKYRIDPQALMLLLKAGRLVIIFEGFDEMSLVGDIQVHLSHFRNLWAFAYPGSKILITGRANFFFNDAEMMAALGIQQPSSQHPYSEAIRLAPFGIQQIRLALRAIEPQICEQICTIAEKDIHFKELISRPSTLFYVSTIWEKENLSERVEFLNSAQVMELFVKDSYRRQSSKEMDARSFMGLYQSEREFFMSGIACFMAANYLQNYIKGNELNHVIENLLQIIPDQVSTMASSMIVGTATPLRLRISSTEHGLELVKIDVRAAGLLVDDPVSPGTFQFGHKSIMEFLFASVLADLLVSKNQAYAQKILEATEATIYDIRYYPVSVDFLAELVPWKRQVIGNRPGEVSTEQDQYIFAKSLLYKIYNSSDIFESFRTRLLLFGELSDHFYESSSRRQKLILLFPSLLSSSSSPSPSSLSSSLIYLLLFTAIVAMVIYNFAETDSSLPGYQGNVPQYIPQYIVIVLSFSFLIIALIALISITYLVNIRKRNLSRSDRQQKIKHRFYKSLWMVWVKICRYAGIPDSVIHRIAGTWLFSWIKNKPIELPTEVDSQ